MSEISNKSLRSDRIIFAPQIFIQFVQTKFQTPVTPDQITINFYSK